MGAFEAWRQAVALRTFRVLKLVLGPDRPDIRASESPLKAFVSSVMIPELQQARDTVVNTLNRPRFLTSWAFEYTPASSEPVDQGYLRHVREADFVLWLAGEETTEPVQKEIREAMASRRQLLAFLLVDSAQRRPSTKAMVGEVGNYAKWTTVGEAAELGQMVDLAIEDEIVRGIRGRPGMGRLARLEEIGRFSRARCIARWQAAGVPRAQCMEMADDPSVAALSSEVLSRPDHPVVVLLGQVGAGKSMTGDRLLQEAIRRVQSDASAPIPVYLEATSITESLDATVLNETRGLGDPRQQGAFVFIDGVEQRGAGLATELLAEARVLGSGWPNTTVVITSRPIHAFVGAEEAIPIPELSEIEANSIVSRISGTTASASLIRSWPLSLSASIRRPLFAVLLGSYLRDQPMQYPRSLGELISHLVERSLIGSQTDRVGQNQTLKRLAVLSVERGGPVSTDDVLPQRADLDLLLGTGLVTEYSRALAFPLPILQQWFAAQSLASGDVTVEEIAGDPK